MTLKNAAAGLPQGRGDPGRIAAQIQPSWIEPLAGHLLKYSYEAPHWDRKRGSVVLHTRAGQPPSAPVPVVDGTSVNLGRAVFVLSTVVLVTGTLVTGTGPHAGRSFRLETMIEDNGYSVETKLVATRDAYMGDFPKDVDIVPEYLSAIGEFLNLKAWGG